MKCSVKLALFHLQDAFLLRMEEIQPLGKNSKRLHFKFDNKTYIYIYIYV